MDGHTAARSGGVRMKREWSLVEFIVGATCFGLMVALVAVLMIKGVSK